MELRRVTHYKGPLIRLLRLMWLDKRLLAFTALFQSLQSISYIPFAASVGWLFNNVVIRLPELTPITSGQKGWMILGWMIANLSLWPIHAWCTVRAFAYSERLMRNTVARIRLMVVEQLQRMALSFYIQRGSGALSNQITVDLSRVEGFLTSVGNSFLVSQVIGGATMIYLAWLNPLLLLLALVAAPLQVAILWIARPKINLAHQRLQKSGESFSAKIVELISGMKQIKSFGNEDLASAQIKESIEEMRHHGMEASILTRWLDMGIQFIFEYSMVILWATGGWFVVAGRANVGDFIAFMALYTNVRSFFGAWISGYEAWMPAAPGMNEIFNILDSRELEEHFYPQVKVNLHGDIRFHGVTFTYPDSTNPSLLDIDLRDYPGSSVSLSTRSGRGPQQQAAFSRRSVIAARLNLRLKRKQKAPR